MALIRLLDNHPRCTAPQCDLPQGHDGLHRHFVITDLTPRGRRRSRRRSDLWLWVHRSHWRSAFFKRYLRNIR